MLLFAALLFPIGLFPPSVAPTPEPPGTHHDARFGRVQVTLGTSTSGEPTVFLWIDGGSAANALPGPETATTILVSEREYLSHGAPVKGHCFYPASDLEELAQDIEKQMGWPTYVHPILAGDGAGAALAFEALESAPEGTFAAAISLGFAPRVGSPAVFCAGDGPHHPFDEKTRTATLQPAARLSAPWLAVQGTEDRVFPSADLRRFSQDMAGAQIVEVAGAGHEISADQSWKAAVLDALDRYRHPPGPAPTATPPPVHPDLHDLPLHDVAPPSESADDRVQILLSGDGGWAGIDRGIAAGFAAEGMRTVGWDSLDFFWKKKTPEECAAALARIIENLPANRRVIVSGFSFGADVIPFAVNRLPDSDRQRVAAVVLISPSREAAFEIHPIDWLFTAKHSGDPATTPELDRLGVPVICLMAKDDKHSPCRAEKRFTTLEGKAGHHLGGDYKAVAKMILTALDVVVPPRPAEVPPPSVIDTSGRDAPHP